MLKLNIYLANRPFAFTIAFAMHWYFHDYISFDDASVTWNVHLNIFVNADSTGNNKILKKKNIFVYFTATHPHTHTQTSARNSWKPCFHEPASVYGWHKVWEVLCWNHIWGLLNFPQTMSYLMPVVFEVRFWMSGFNLVVDEEDLSLQSDS